ncbi:hypothetical protein JL721_9075 [Aureococcus anophagefferens]|nr:hypothetical protein JL721_9075 [Aureococcus anophagefferens]
MDPSSAAAIASHSGELFEESGADDIVRREPRAAPQGSSSQRRALDVADDMVLEYIAFRGFTETFRSFSLARADDRANRGSFDARFAVDALLRPARDLDALGLLDAWDFLEARFFGNLDAELAAHVGGLRCGVYRLFCVTAAAAYLNLIKGTGHVAPPTVAGAGRPAAAPCPGPCPARPRRQRRQGGAGDGLDRARAPLEGRGPRGVAPRPAKHWRGLTLGASIPPAGLSGARPPPPVRAAVSGARPPHPPRVAGMAATENMKLELQSAILEEAIGQRLLDGKREPCEIPCADFDARPGLLQHGGAECLETTYSGMVSQPEPGYSVALSANADETSSPEDLLSKLVLVKRNLMGAPFQKAFSSLAAGTAKDLPVARLPWRKNESVYIVAGNDPAMPSNWDRVTIVFSVDFPEESDRAYCRIFLQQLQDVGRKVNNAPPVVFSEAKEPPLEIRDTCTESPLIVGFVSFTIFDHHVKTPAKLAKTIDNLIGFRNYLHFHIKAAKTNLHMRMRRKVNSWIQIVNRAIMTADKPKDMKTSSGKTCTRK